VYFAANTEGVYLPDCLLTNNTKQSIMKTQKILVFTCLFLFFTGFLSAQIKPYDILISEFMPAPSTANTKLPSVEYIELYNHSKQSINLEGYKIWNGSAVTVLPKHSALKPDSFLVIYTKKADIDFKLIDTIQVTKLVTLSNPNDIFYLTTPKDTIIDAASYDLSFYQNVNKAEPGLALERTRLNAPCDVSAWRPSNSALGGTPGKKNSDPIDLLTDLTAPLVERYYVSESGKTVFLTFNKTLNRTIAVMTSQYQLYGNIKVDSNAILKPYFSSVAETLSPSQILIDSVKFPKMDENSAFITVELSLKTPLRDSLYKLVVKPISKDCQDKDILSKIYNTVYIQKPEKPDSNLIINEILVNPETGGSRFIELYNRSKKTFSLGSLEIKDNTRGDVKSVTTNFLLFPKHYVVLTEKPFYIRNRYKADSFKFFIIKNKLPTWNEASGNVMLFNNNIVFDSFSYNKSWHNALLSTTDGVSLERLNQDSSSSEFKNWQSASEKSGFATPSQKNSQSRNFQPTPSVHAPFWLEKSNFSPDDDGFEDALLIHYVLKKSGGMANIRIYDSSGHSTKSLSINELLGTEGVLRWQGERSDGTKASVGIYIMVIDVIFPDGSTTRQKLPCALATQF
jgi:hypothetical protein